MQSEEHKKILSLIKEIRNSHSAMIRIFSCGSCLNLFCILQVVYPEAEAYFNIDHIVTKINGRYYDIRGELSRSYIEKYKFRKYSDVFYPEEFIKSFADMYEGEIKL